MKRKDFDATIAIIEKDKSALWDILDEHDGNISELKLENYPHNFMRNVIGALKTMIEYASEYESVCSRMNYYEKLWNIAREFINSKNWQDEFNTLANQKM